VTFGGGEVLCFTEPQFPYLVKGKLILEKLLRNTENKFMVVKGEGEGEG